MTAKAPTEVAQDVINGMVEEHDTRWWRNRATTLAFHYLNLRSPETLAAMGLEVPSCEACNGMGRVSDMNPWGGERVYDCPDCGGTGMPEEES